MNLAEGKRQHLGTVLAWEPPQQCNDSVYVVANCCFFPFGLLHFYLFRCLSGSKTICVLVTPVIVWFLLLAWKLWKRHVSLSNSIYSKGLCQVKVVKPNAFPLFLCDRKELLAIYFEEQLTAYSCSKVLIIFKPINIYSLKKSFNGDILVSLFRDLLQVINGGIMPRGCIIYLPKNFYCTEIDAKDCSGC